MSDAFAGLFRSRKFWLAILDLVISVILLIVGEFFPAYQDLVKELIAMLQPVILLIIGAIAVEDFAEKFGKK